MTSLEDYIAIYPPQDDPNIQAIISNKEEFIQLNGKPVEPVPERGEKFLHQEYFLRFMMQYDRIYKIDSMGTGKCLYFNTPVLMYTGEIKMVQDIKPGEYVMGPDSRKRKVLDTTKGVAEMFEVIPAKGRSFTCNGPHILTLKGLTPYIQEVNRPSKYAVKFSIEGMKKSKAFKTIEEAEEFKETLGEDIFDVPLEEYVEWPAQRRNNTYLFHTGIDFKSRSVPIDPYMIGYWLGDGDTKKPVITTDDKEIVEYYTENLPLIDCQLNRKNDDSGMHYYISGSEEKNKKGVANGNHFLNSLRGTNMLGNKHIPDIYKINSRRKRLALLAGLIDSDGHKDKKGNYYEITQKSKKLADDIEYLCFSLGFMVTMTKVTKGCPVKGEMVYGEYYRINIFGDGLEDVPVLLERKKSSPRLMNKRATCQSFKIRPVGEDKYYGFQLNKDGRFLLGDFTVTHNSCTMVGLAEALKEYPNRFRHTYVLEKSRTTLHEFKNQIVCKCTKFGVYETEAIRRATDSKIRAANITNEIKSWYTVTTYTKFGSMCEGMSDAQIKEKFSNCIFFLDEAHNLRNTKSQKEEKKSEEKTGKEAINNQRAYWNIWKVCHVAENIKVVVATATPNINNVGDFVPTANLLLPADKQLPYHIEDSFGQDKHFVESNKFSYDYRFVTIKQMEPFFRGLFSYVRALDMGVDVINMGTNLGKTVELDVVSIFADLKPLITVNKDGSYKYHKQELTVINKENYTSQLIVYPVRMSPYQSLIFSRADESGKYTGVQGKHHSSEFVFPDGSFGGNLDFFRSPEKVIANEKKPVTGMSKYITRRGTGDYVANKILKDILSNPDKLYEHSCKFYEILRIEEDNPSSKCFIFTDAVTGAGAILLALMFEEYGYEKYDRSESSFNTTADGKREVIIEKRKRYAILSNDSTSGKLPSLMEMFNDPVNKNADYIKVMIGAPVSRDGINLYDVVRAYLLRAGWHPAGDLQALHRILRAVSHEALKKEKAKYYLEHGIEGDIRIDVQIYRMCSYTHPDIIKKGEEEEKLRKKSSVYQIEEEEKRATPKSSKKTSVSKKISSSEESSSEPIKKTPTSKTSKKKESSTEESSPEPVKRKTPKIPIRPTKRIILSSESDSETEVIISKKSPVSKSSRKILSSESETEGIKPVKKKKGGYTVPSSETKGLKKRTSERFDYSTEECISIDMELYIKGEIKDFYNRRMMRIWKILAMDAINNKNRNVLTTDKLGTMDTDYAKEKFLAWSEDPRLGKVDKYVKPDYTTYDVLYANKEITEIANKIVEYLVDNGFLSMQKLLEEWVDSGKYREKLVWMALDNLIYNNKEITNKFGFPAYINTDGKKYIYLQSDFPFDNKSQDLIYYSNMVAAVVQPPLSEVLNDIIYAEQEAIINDILNIKGEIDEEKGDLIEGYLSKLTLNYRASLVERILLAYMKTDELLEEELEEIKRNKKDKSKSPKSIIKITPKQPVYKPKKSTSSSDSEPPRRVSPPSRKEASPKTRSLSTSESEVKTVPKSDSSPVVKPATIKIKVKTTKKKKKTKEINPGVIKYIMNRFKAYIYVDVLEPYADINKMVKLLSKKNTKGEAKRKSAVKVVYSGRAKTNWANKEGIPYEEGDIIDPSKSRRINRVYLHTLFTRAEENADSYKTWSKFSNVDGLIRILKPVEEIGWRDASIYEKDIYRELVKEEMTERMSEYDKYRIYGTLLADGKFRIVDRSKEREGSDKDHRLLSKGSICKDMKEPDIIKEILMENSISKEINDVVLPSTKRKDMIISLVKIYHFTNSISDLKDYSHEDLEFILKIYHYGAKRTYLCDFLRDKFKREGKMLYAD